MSLSVASIYGANTASVGGPQLSAVAPDANMLGARPTSGAQPAFSWIALLGALVALRILQEMAD